jgi:uncharacterized protein RhaS with RHS repeats
LNARKQHIDRVIEMTSSAIFKRSALALTLIAFTHGASARYVESDPIGLAGGVSTYGYVRANPLKRKDPLGLVDLNLYPSTDPNHDGAEIYKSPDGSFTVGGHGNPTVMTDAAGHFLTPTQLADLITHNKHYTPGQTVDLYSCNVGLSPEPGKESYAEQVAKALNNGSVVGGADNFVWFEHYGRSVVIAPIKGSTINWKTFYEGAGAPGPDLTAQGKLNFFTGP